MSNQQKFLTEAEENVLLKISRRAIEEYLDRKRIITKEELIRFGFNVTDRLLEKRNVFVSLHNKSDGALRGCIGDLFANESIINLVIKNSLAAAFGDPRFPPVSKEELNNLVIEISLISPLVKLASWKDIIENKHGVLLIYGKNRATFLPQVWKKLKTKEEFLHNLCLKAGLSGFEWKEKDAEFFIYEVEKFSDDKFSERSA